MILRRRRDMLSTQHISVQKHVYFDSFLRSRAMLVQVSDSQHCNDNWAVDCGRRAAHSCCEVLRRGDGSVIHFGNDITGDDASFLCYAF